VDSISGTVIPSVGRDSLGLEISLHFHSRPTRPTAPWIKAAMGRCLPAAAWNSRSTV